MRELNAREVAEVSGGVMIQIGRSDGTHIKGKLSDFGNAAYMYGRAFPFSGLGIAGMIYKHLMVHPRMN